MAKNSINKINQLFIAEGFIQVNFIKGYKYIDRAGELVNYFHKDKTAPKFAMDLGGLVIYNPDEKIEEIKVSSTSFWAHFVSPDSLEVMDDFYKQKVSDIVKVLDIEEVARVGWRNYFVYEFKDETDREASLKKFIPINGMNLEEIYFTSECNKIQLNIRIRKVLRNNDKTGGVETPAILIDMDFFNKYEDNLTSDKLVTELGKIKDVIRSDEFLVMINSIIE